MEKRKRGLLIAIAVLVIVVAVYLLSLYLNQEDEEAEETGDTSLIVSNEDSSNITAISYEKDGVSFSFVLENGTWIYEEDEDFPVLQDSLTAMANELAAVTAIRKLEEPEALSEYGLDEPALTVRYTNANGDEAEFIVGDTNDTAGGDYLQIVGDEAVYVVSSDFAEAFLTDLYEMADMEEFPTMTSDEITSISIASGEHILQMVTSESSSTGWNVTDDGESLTDISSSALTSLINSVTGITFSSHVDYDCEDMALYGLDEPVMQVTVNYTETVTVESDDDDTNDSSDNESADETEDDEDETETVQVAKEVIVYVGAQNDDGYYYAAMDGSTEIHMLTASLVETLMSADAVSLMDDSIITGTLDSAAAIDITLDGETWNFVKETVVVEEDSDEDTEVADETETEDADEDETETETLWYCDDTEIELTYLSSAYSRLSGMEAESILEEEAETLDAETVSVTITWEDGTETTVIFTEYDSSYQLATVDGVSRKLVNRRDVESMIEAFEELVN